MNVRKAMLIVLAGGYLILWVGGVGSHFWYGRTPDGATWAAPAFLLLAGLLVLVTAKRTDRLTLLMVGVLGFVAEAMGVHFGVPFGRYEYTAVLQPQLIGVPLVMAAAWLVLVAYVRAMLTGWALSPWLATLSASAWMTAIDLLIDPFAAGALRYWRWLEGGAYYGIPLQNFLGWFVVSSVIFLLLKVVPAPAAPAQHWPAAIGLSILCFFTLIALARQQTLLASIGGGLCLAHWFIAHKQNRRGSVNLRNPHQQRLPTIHA